MVSYWHWHSIHNSAETYWKGLLSHDFEPNPTYEEAKTIGADFSKLSDRLVNLEKKNQVAILFSNEALTAFNSFSIGEDYNGVLRRMYDALYRMNVEADLIDPSSSNLESYRLIVVPALYAAPDSLLQRLNRFIKQGGHVVFTFKSGFCDQYVKVRNVIQPGIISEACGIRYSQFTAPDKVGLKGGLFQAVNENNPVERWMELLEPTTATVLAYYDHPVWGKYAAVTENKYGKGVATYIGAFTSPDITVKILEHAVKGAGLWGTDQELQFPLIVKSGTNQYGKIVRYYFNYSARPKTFSYPYRRGTLLISGKKIEKGGKVELAAWGFAIIKEE